MRGPGWRPGDMHPDEIEDLLFEAARRYHHLVGGAHPEGVPTSLRLDVEEIAYFDGHVDVARYDYLELGERITAGLLGAPNAVRFLRGEVEPSWRPQGLRRVVLTDQRLLVLDHGRWVSYRHPSVAEFLPEPVDFVVTLVLHDLQPLRLSGPELASLAVVYASLLYQAEELPRLPGFARFDPDTT
ncbi:hypothetical protein [Actinophytocola xinjiangensis]|nr:hypothetical protein [Actinophytocola xinjiangensis]